jgi:hypothetical protein
MDHPGREPFVGVDEESQFTAAVVRIPFQMGEEAVHCSTTIGLP